jgi:hypothetical protein
MLDERVVHRRTAERAEEGEGLRGDLLRDHQSEACSDLGDELQQDRRSFLEEAALTGNGMDEGVALGPLIDGSALAKVEEHVSDAVAA